MITASTRIRGSFAIPNRSTPVPVMHNAGFNALGVDFRYFAFEPRDIGAAMNSVRSLDFAGATVSKPYKQTVIPYLDEIDPVAAAIGAVNVVHNQDGRLVGYNSDWIGAVAAVKEHGDLRDARVGVLGAGGAARAIAYGLVKSGANVAIFNRSSATGTALSDDLGVTYGGSLGDVGTAACDVIINATSFGHGNDDDVPVPAAAFSATRVVMDIVVRPTISPFLARASRSGATIIDGVRMHVLQGAFAFEKFTGLPAPVDVMQNAVVEALSSN
jgi:shikimate dehydrogenase